MSVCFKTFTVLLHVNLKLQVTMKIITIKIQFNTAKKIRQFRLTTNRDSDRSRTVIERKNVEWGSSRTTWIDYFTTCCLQVMYSTCFCSLSLYLKLNYPCIVDVASFSPPVHRQIAHHAPVCLFLFIQSMVSACWIVM